LGLFYLQKHDFPGKVLNVGKKVKFFAGFSVNNLDLGKSPNNFGVPLSDAAAPRIQNVLALA
jgi:hypothetical protein